MKLCAILMTLVPTVVIATCYTPDGVAITDDSYQPCSSLVSASMCCATNRDYDTDLCLPNGLCFDQGTGTGGGKTSTWRESCTDPTWQSAFCLGSICTDSSSGGNSTNDSQVTSCPTDGSYCCGSMTEAVCCASNEKFALPATIGVSSTSSNTASSTSASRSSTTISTSSTSTTASSITSTSSKSTTASSVKSTSSISTTVSSVTSTARTSITASSVTSISTRSTTTSSITPASSGTASDTSTNPSLPTLSSTNSLKLGLGLGLGLGIPLLFAIAAIAYFLRRRIQSQRKYHHPVSTPNSNEGEIDPGTKYALEGAPIYEKIVNPIIHEANGTSEYRELAA